MSYLHREVICQCCGAAFCPLTNKYNVKRVKYCSKQCNAKAHWRAKTKWSPPKERICIACGKAFTPDHFHPNAPLCGKKCIDRHYYIKNKEKIFEYVRAWSANNPEKRRQYFRAIYHRNIEAMRIQKKVRIAASISKAEFIKMCERTAYRCAHCGELFPAFRLSVDHIHPVSKGGTNHPKNLQILCLLCNQRKGARPNELYASKSIGVNHLWYPAPISAR